MLSFLTFGCEAKVLSRRNVVEENYDRSREGRGLEDTDTGICQTNGMEPNNLNLRFLSSQFKDLIMNKLNKQTAL